MSRLYCLTYTVLVLAVGSAVQVAAVCNMPLEVRVAAKDDWQLRVANVTLIGPHYSDNAALATDAVPATAFDRMQNITLWVSAAQLALAFTVNTYTNGSTATGLMASVWFAGSLLTQTGQPGWTVSTVAPSTQDWLGNSASPDGGAAWSSAVNCTVSPADVNAYGQPFTDFVTPPSLNSLQPAWISPGGTCTTTVAGTYYVRVVITLPPIDPSLCPAANTVESIMTSTNPILSHTIGPQTDSTQPLMVRLTADNDYMLYVANYTVVGPRESEYSVPYAWQRIMDLRLNLVPGKYLFAMSVTDWGNARGFITSLLYQNAVFSASDGRSQWKITSSQLNARPGWNTDYGFDTTGWADLDQSMVCPYQQTWNDVQRIFSGLGGCPQWMFYQGCMAYAIGTQVFVRFTFDLTANVFSQPQLACRNTTSNPCPPGGYPSPDSLSCMDCPVGTYKPLTGNGRCSTCPARMTTIGTSSASCVCAPNYEMVKPGICTGCATGQYKITAGNSTCAPCIPNAYCTSTTPFSCLAGYTRSADNTSCVTCDPGTYKSVTSNSPCTACPVGTSTPSAGATSINACVCDVDYSWDGATCNKCPPGTRKATVGNTNCFLVDLADCPANMIKTADGQCISAPQTTDLTNTTSQQPAVGTQKLTSSITFIAAASALCAVLIAAAVMLVIRIRRLARARTIARTTSSTVQYSSSSTPLYNSQSGINSWTRY